MKYALFGFDEIDVYDIEHGFDKIEIASELEGFSVDVIDYIDVKRLKGYDGIILPNGIFEDVAEYEYNCDLDELNQAERIIHENIKNGGWVCFLVDKINWTYTNEDDMDTNTPDIDLIKRILTVINVDSWTVEGDPYIKHYDNTFSEFLDYGGVGKTYFESMIDSEKFNKLITNEDNDVFGFEYEKRYFFLPQVHAMLKTNTIVGLIPYLIESINKYRTKGVINLPEWLSDKNFEEENENIRKLKEIENERVICQAKLEAFRRYKGILLTQGETLRCLVAEVLKDYFDLNVDTEDNGIEDLKVNDDEGKIKYFVEVKGTTKGISRSHINQLDSHRERTGYEPDIRGLLIINTQMDKEDFDKRVRSNIEAQHLNRAKVSNILIIRTIDLFLFMLEVENNSDRKELLIDKIDSVDSLFLSRNK